MTHQRYRATIFIILTVPACLVVYSLLHLIWFFIAGMALTLLAIMALPVPGGQKRPRTHTHKLVTHGKVVPASAVPELRSTRAPKDTVRPSEVTVKMPKTTQNVRKLQARNAALLEFADLHGWGAEIRDIISNVDKNLDRKEAN